MNIGIVGLGLIGGSLALDLKPIQDHKLLGFSRKETTCQYAIARGIVDAASTDLSLMSEADLIFLCTPLSSLVPTVEALLPHLKPEIILTDVGSVKQPVVEAIAPLWPNFVGGHPMAGTAKSGLDAAVKDLFVNRPYVLTPTQETPEPVVNRVSEVVRSLRANLYLCEPDVHDRAVAAISHVPVMVSASLISTCMAEPDPTVLELSKKLASSGFRDTSRVGGGNPELGVLMAHFNREAVLNTLYRYREQLDALVTLIERENWSTLEAHLTQTQAARLEFVPPQDA